MINSIAPSSSMFQIAWESTLKCNLDCSYCGDGHDNSQSHPSLEDSLKTIDFIVDYVDLYMQTKPIEHRVANLNIQGGESIYHPNIVEILEYARAKTPDWNLYINLTTNAVIVNKQWKNIADLINYFTFSYHPESTEKQQSQIRENILYTKSLGKGYQVAVLMHPGHWDNCVAMIEWCKTNDVKYIARQIDHTPDETRFNYTNAQSEFITGKKVIPIKEVDLSSVGRACCGGMTMCTNSETETKYIENNNFYGWHCSVNRHFLYIRQTTGEVFTNKDCKMNFDGEVGPIGYLNNIDKLLEDTRNNLGTNIICKKTTCWCGLCAPKARDKDTYDTIMKQYLSKADQSPL